MRNSNIHPIFAAICAPLTPEEISTESLVQAIAEECKTCVEITEKYGGFGPSHDGSKFCESGSIASGGSKAHCSCDWCF